MRSSYHPDPETVSLRMFQQSLKKRDLIPSRMILKTDLKNRFDRIRAHGVTNLKELIEATKTKAKLVLFSRETGLEVEYLTVLKREAKSTLPNPVNLAGFPSISKDTVSRLQKSGIKNSKQLFDATMGAENKKLLRETTGIEETELDPIIELCDLVRLYGVGPVFAEMLRESGINSVSRFIELSPREIVQFYETRTGRKADFAEKDISYTHELAGLFFQ